MFLMKKAVFTNFRQLRDISIEFGENSEKPLTIIRAENRTGKTTMLTALSWALFGDKALRNRSEYRMHPLDWNHEAEGFSVDISVEIYFDIDQELDGVKERESYRLRRSSTENIDQHDIDKFAVSTQTVILQKISEKGFEDISNPNAVISKKFFPDSLREIFFTDGDRTLKFIDSEDSVTRRKDRVRQAVKHLLQLEVLERLQKHLVEVNKEYERSLASGKVEDERDAKTVERYYELSKELDDIPQEILEAEQELDTAQELLEGSEKDLSNAKLALGGDPADMQKNILAWRDKKRSFERQIIDDYQCLSDSLKDYIPQIYAEMCRDDVDNLSDYLDDLNQRGALPEVVPDIIQERLEKDLCICGTKISENKSIEEYLRSQLESSMLPGESDALVQLRSSIADWQRQTQGELSFSKSARFKLGNLAKSRSEITKLDKDISENNSKLDNLGDLNIQDLKRRLMQHRDLQQEAYTNLTRLETTFKIKNDELTRLKPEYTLITRKSHRYELQSRKNEVCEDLIGIVKGIISSMGVDTLEEVSLEMNRIFESINVQEGNTGSLIRKVFISSDYEIVVEGSTGKNLAPSTDISGAQKRALTLAFIFATVNVSGYDLPNFIDTPLGTQSGEVKRSMVEFTARNTRQCILFLTASEIAGVESALRQYTSRYYTLSHADHYPNELVNEPTVPTRSAFVCGCSIDESCIRCERKPLLSN